MTIVRPERVTDADALINMARVEDPEDRERFYELTREAELRKGAAVFTECVVNDIDGDDVTIGASSSSVTFHARPLSRLFAKGATVYPYVATCGREMAEFGESLTDPLEKYWWDVIMQGAVMHARNAMYNDVSKIAGYEPVSANPGSIEMWPISNQPALFSLIGDVTGMIGVTIATSFLMIPLKSVSGIFFPGANAAASGDTTASNGTVASGVFTHNCCICTRENCSGRRAPFDAQLKAQLENNM